MAITRSLFIFTMAMSVFHNPSDNEIGSHVQPLLRLTAQALRLRLGFLPISSPLAAALASA